VKRVKDGRRVLMGQITTGTYQGMENRIQLFDGMFTTGYRIVEFEITPDQPTAQYEIIAKLCTEPKSTLAYWHWDDVQELAWAGWNIPFKGTPFKTSEIREDNMVIEDLWITAYNPSEASTMNYKIVLEKYSFPAWDGAGILVENLSQAGPQ
jgi:hypothetical protein